MNKLNVKIAALLLGILGLSLVFAARASAAPPLPAEKAFVFSAYVENPRTIVAEWQIAPGYFLYRDKLHIVSQPAHPARLGPLRLPKSKRVYLHSQTDNKSLAYQVFQGKIRVLVPLRGKGQDALNIAVSYQGCAADGFCYAPVKKLLHLSYPFSKQGLQHAPLLTIRDDSSSPPASIAIKSVAPKANLMTDQRAAATFMGTHSLAITLLCFLGLGFLLAFTPCSLPMIPILSAIIVGQKKSGTLRSFYLSLSYVLGVSLTYALAGMMLAWLGSGVQAYFQNPWIITAFSGIFACLALSMLGVFELRFPGRWQQKIMHWQRQQRGGSYWGSFWMGCFSTLIISPCVTAPLVGVLAYVGETGNLILGATALFALGLGMGLPLLALGFSVGKYLPKAGPWMEIIQKVFAFLLLGVAVMLLSRILPGSFALFLWATLFISIAVYFFFAVEELSRVWRYFGYIMGVVLGLYGFTLYMGVSMNYTSPLYPFQKLQLAVRKESVQTLDFVTVKNMNHLNRLLQQAKREKRPVMIDFYAKWCESCHAMEEKVLSALRVQKALKHFVLMRADVTENNNFDQTLLRHYKVIAPPTFVFLNRRGKELADKRIVGEVDRQTFLEKIGAL